MTLYEGLQKVKVISNYNATPVCEDKLYNMIDYIDDERRCVLSKGKWYYFNDDYLEYLADSLGEKKTRKPKNILLVDVLKY